MMVYHQSADIHIQRKGIQEPENYKKLPVRNSCLCVYICCEREYVEFRYTGHQAMNMGQYKESSKTGQVYSVCKSTYVFPVFLLAQAKENKLKCKFYKKIKYIKSLLCSQIFSVCFAMSDETKVSWALMKCLINYCNITINNIYVLVKTNTYQPTSLNCRC